MSNIDGFHFIAFCASSCRQQSMRAKFAMVSSFAYRFSGHLCVRCMHEAQGYPWEDCSIVWASQAWRAQQPLGIRHQSVLRAWTCTICVKGVSSGASRYQWWACLFTSIIIAWACHWMVGHFAVEWLAARQNLQNATFSKDVLSKGGANDCRTCWGCWCNGGIKK